jgi:hypothetical protein
LHMYTYIQIPMQSNAMQSNSHLETPHSPSTPFHLNPQLPPPTTLANMLHTPHLPYPTTHHLLCLHLSISSPQMIEIQRGKKNRRAKGNTSPSNPKRRKHQGAYEVKPCPRTKNSKVAQKKDYYSTLENKNSKIHPQAELKDHDQNPSMAIYAQDNEVAPKIPSTPLHVITMLICAGIQSYITRKDDPRL